MKKNQTLLQLSSDLVDEVWKERPPNDALPVNVHPVEFAGRSVAEKIKELREKLQHEKATAIIISALDEVYIVVEYVLFCVACVSILISFISHDLLGCLVVQCSRR